MANSLKGAWFKLACFDTFHIFEHVKCNPFSWMANNNLSLRFYDK